jgi:hypothetical protein
MPASTPSTDGTAPALAQLSEADRAAALLRFRVLRPHLEDGVPAEWVRTPASLLNLRDRHEPLPDAAVMLWV